MDAGVLALLHVSVSGAVGRLLYCKVGRPTHEGEREEGREQEGLGSGSGREGLFWL